MSPQIGSLSGVARAQLSYGNGAFLDSMRMIRPRSNGNNHNQEKKLEIIDSDNH